MEDIRSPPMSSGRPTVPVILTLRERTTLQRWRRIRGSGPLAQRARIVLGCAAGATNEAVAAGLGVTRQTVGRWRRRFASRRLEGLADAPRPGAPRKISDARIGRAVRLILTASKRDGGRSSTRSLARRSGLSQTSISRLWRALRLRGRSRSRSLSR
jgi:transposase